MLSVAREHAHAYANDRNGAGSSASADVGVAQPTWCAMIDAFLSGVYTLRHLERKFGGQEAAAELWLLAYAHAREHDTEAASQCVVAACHYHARAGCVEDCTTALDWFRRAAAQGHALAQYHVGMCYNSGEGVAKDGEVAVHWFQLAAAQGLARAQHAVAYHTTDAVAAFELYLRAAEQGFVDSQYAVARCYVDGKGVEKSDAASIEWYRRAGEQGHTRALECLADCYLEGRGVAKCKVAAFEWSLRAAELGWVPCQVRVSDCYARGSVVKQNYSLALEWLRKAAAQGQAFVWAESLKRLEEHVAAELVLNPTPVSLRCDATSVVVAHHALSDAEFDGVLVHMDANAASIERIEIRGCSLTNAHLERLAPLLEKCSSLSHLDLSLNKVGTEGRAWLALVDALQVMSSLVLLNVEGDGNCMGGDAFVRLFEAVRHHDRLETLRLHTSVGSLALDATTALANMLTDNQVLRSAPIERLVYACVPQFRYLVLDALKINIGLCSNEWSALLPREVRILFRRFRGLDVRQEVRDERALGHDGTRTSFIIDPRRLSPESTWRLLGSGAFGQAFEASLVDECNDDSDVDFESSASPVCVKTITQQHNDTERGCSFFREVALLHEAGVDNYIRFRAVCVCTEHVLFPPGRNDTIWLVAPLMRNGSLEDACRADRLDAAARLRIVADVAWCVETLHSIDIVHRDIAARNVLLSDRDRAKLCDLGLACRTAHAWACPNTPVYNWPPESVFSGVYSRASDVWAVGVLIFETMLGHNPLAALPLEQLVRAYHSWSQCAEQEWRLVEALGSVDRLSRHIDAAPAGSYFSALALDPPEAVTTAYYSSSAVAQAADVHASAAQNDSSVYASSSLICAPALENTVDTWWQQNMRLPDASPQWRALGIVAHACCRFQPSQRPSAKFAAKLLASVTQTKQKVDDEVRLESATEVLVVAQLYMLGIERARWWWCAINDSLCGDAAMQRALTSVIEWYRAALCSAEEVHGPLHSETGIACARLAVLLAAANQRDEARALRDRAKRVREGDLESETDPWKLSRHLDELAQKLKADGDYVAARQTYERALAVREKAYGAKHTSLTPILLHLANLLKRQGDAVAARSTLDRALTINEQAHGRNRPEVVSTLDSLALLMKSEKDTAGASAVYERILAIDEAHLGPLDAKVAADCFNLAGTLQQQGKHAAALPLVERAVAIDEAAAGSMHPRLVKRLVGLVRVLDAVGEPQRSAEVCARIRAINVKARSMVVGQCAAHHALADGVAARSGFQCDDCGASIDEGARVHSCRACDYDRCAACVECLEREVGV